MPSIQETIAKLLALSNSPNEHEAALAAEKASELALKYNIDLSKLKQQSNYTDTTLETKTKNWQENIIQGVAKLNAVKIYVAMPSHIVHLVGRPHNIEITKSISTYLITAVLRANTQACPPGLSQSERATFRRSFRLGASRRLYQRLDNKFTSLNTQDHPQTKALVVKSYYDQELAAIEEYLSDIELKPKATRSHPSDLNAYLLGAEAANNISLEEQINGIHSPRLLGQSSRTRGHR